MKINVLAFGIAKEIVGRPKEVLDVSDGITAGELKVLLEEKYPDLLKLRSYFLAVNEEYATEEQSIKADDEIALIPPVSGG
ncbi:molybdopterin synthase sulfur carrier subunit [Sphingobacterium allocomposti]|uniref:Molybdopterin synthase sulfur carrier subunit n=1 Tax=Sphingobacterium allocomposti TaxID=415956 RepID=A0A5S5DIE6_9SPHI|nr:molybdopterin converting factor subunit 1 [Sphingobacterium composti Yoo et al. 2007 non Ten et al. 2007]TYP94462.1 molybdopterin synthase sulfur carrier subunit [Sphingobacterium composti Yoo et al. 2007 non Ten et al. 2007]